MPIIEYLPENIKLKEREEIEESWMLKLNTLFPYGLNVRCKKAKIDDSDVTVTTSKDIIYSKFDVVKIKRTTRGGISDNTLINTVFDPKEFFKLIITKKLVGIRNIRPKFVN